MAEFDTSTADGIITPGNLDPWDRPVLHNDDGSYSTTSSMSIGTDKGETLIPTVVGGTRLSEEDAIKHFHDTGEHLGVFDTPEHADAYATGLHNAQAAMRDGNGDLLPKPNPLIPGGGLEPPVMSEMSTARSAGHEWDAIDQYMDERRQASRLGGYSDAEVNQYLGYKSPDLRLAAIGQEANFLTYANDADGTASPAQGIAHASGNLFQPTALGKPLMQDGPVPPELRSEYAQGLMGGEFPDAGHFAQAYTSGIFNAAGLDGGHPLAKQAMDELTDKLPKAQDLIDWSLALNGDPTLVRQSLMQHWVDTGEGPKEAYQRAQTDNDFRLNLTTPKPEMPPTIGAKIQAHYGDPTLDERFMNIWGGDMLPGADTLQPAVAGVMNEIGQQFGQGFAFDDATGRALKAGAGGFQVGVQGIYDSLVAKGFVRPEDGTFAPLNMINKAVALPFALLAGAGTGVGDMVEKYGEEIGQPLLGRTLNEMIVNWGGQLGSPHGGVHDMNPAMLNKIDSTVRLLVDTFVDDVGAKPNPLRAAPLGREPGDIMPPTSGAFNRFHEKLPAGTVLPFDDAGVRVHDDVRQFQGNISADRTDWNAQERTWAKSHPDWFEPDFMQKVTNEVEQRGVDGTALSPDVDAFWSNPEWRGARKGAFKDWSEHELRIAGEEGREPANRALEPFDDNFIPRHIYNTTASADPLVPQWLEEAEPGAFGTGSFRRRSGPALRTEGRQFYAREYEDGTRELADNSRSKDKVQFGDVGRSRGKTFTVRDATLKEIAEGTADRMEPGALDKAADGKTRLYKAEKADDAAPGEGWVRNLDTAERDAREKGGEPRTGKIHYMDVDPREKTSQQRPLYPDPTTGALTQDPSFPRRYNLDEKLFPTGTIDTGPVAKSIAGREPKEVPYGAARPQPMYRMDPIRNLRDSWLSNRMKSYGAQFLVKNREELEGMGMFKRPSDDLGNWQKEKPPQFDVKDPKTGKVKTQAGAPIDLPLGFKGWVPKDLKLEFDRYLGPLRGDDAASRVFDAWDKANRFLIRSLFVSPLPHEFNVAAHYIVGRGLWGTLGPPGMYRAVRFTGEAAHQVFTNGTKYSEMQRAGGGLLFGRTIGQDIAKLHTDQMAKAITTSPAWADAAKAIGMSPVRLVKGLYRATQKNLWFVNDTLMMSRVLELQNLRGINMVEAIREAEREIASYDMPTKVLRSSLLSDLLSQNKIVAFGRYDTNRISIWKNMVTDLVGKSRGDGIGTWSDLKVRSHALDQAAMAAALIVFGAPLANAVWQKVSGNPAAKLMAPGPLFVMDMAKRLKDGDLGNALPFHLSALLNNAPLMLHNLNPFGKPLINGHRDYAGIMADTARAAGSLIPPVNTARQVLEGMLPSPNGKRPSGTMTPADALAKTVFNARLPPPGTVEAQAAAKKRADSEALSADRKDPLAAAIRAMTGGTTPAPARGRSSNAFDQQSGVYGKAKNPFDQ